MKTVEREFCARQDKPCCGAYTNSTVSGVPTCIDAVADVIEKRPARRSHETISTTPRKSHLSTSTCRGIWSPFSPSSISSCDGSCGLCGHRVVAERRCIPEGCQCDGSNKLHERCGEKPCWALQNSCCPGASIVLVDGKRICKEDN
ncbi:hypothetical protein PFISCL1PPCAC_29083 [Pristionchus fissidentatus]|uniref:Uncharacterized protein n=1 Tax=Pristionchus fissidentatus TaxID=1538716 RepID=A0AAV5WZB2_9BILA|nr:hypothetical protein PFISCL1PPCAC_29083 [Pristionchus fissidentatus]